MAGNDQTVQSGNRIQQAGTRSMNGGRITGIPPHLVGAQESPNCSDTDPVFPWGAKTRNGSTAFGLAGPTAASGSPVGGIKPIIMNGGSQYIYAAVSTRIFYVATGAAWVEIGSAMSTDSIMQAEILNNTPIILASGLALQYSSTGTSTLTAIPAGTYLPSFGKYITQYVSKIWTAGDPGNPSRTSFCTSQTPLDFSTTNNAGYIEIGVGDGDIVRGLEGTKNAVYVFKRKNTYAVTGTSVFDFSATLLCEWGLVSEYAHCSDGQGCFFASDDGIYYAVGLNVARLSDSIKVDFDNISDKTTIAMEVLGEKLYVFFKDSGASVNTTAFVCAYKRKLDGGQVHGVWTKYTSVNVKAAGTSRQQELFTVTANSTPMVYQMDTGSSSIGFVWNTPDEDFGDVGYKQLVRYFVHAQPGVATYTVNVQPFADGASIGGVQTISIPPTGSTSSGYIVGSHWVGMATPGQNIRGRFIRLQFTVSGNNCLFGYRMFCDVRSEGMARI